MALGLTFAQVFVEGDNSPADGTCPSVGEIVTAHAFVAQDFLKLET